MEGIEVELMIIDLGTPTIQQSYWYINNFHSHYGYNYNRSKEHGYRGHVRPPWVRRSRQKNGLVFIGVENLLYPIPTALFNCEHVALLTNEIVQTRLILRAIFWPIISVFLFGRLRQTRRSRAFFFFLNNGNKTLFRRKSKHK